MTDISRTKALRLLRKKYGRSVTMSEDKGAFTPEQRAERRRQIEELEKQKPEMPPEVIEYNRRVRAWQDEIKGLRNHLWRQRWNASADTGLGIFRRGFMGDTIEALLRHAEVPLD